jgi:phospho-N-acetylmuramoyl-pentapeptide-transferase
MAFSGISSGASMLYILWAAFIVVGAANAANLTDGLNGLLAGCAGIAFLFFAMLAACRQIPEAGTFSLIASGAVFSFLYFNFPKAKVFMGDVGALSIGAALGGLALIMHKEINLALIGGVFVIEALSVIIQVLWYKFFKRRIFKMAPLHHHFELMGFKETTVVIGLWITGLIFGIAGIFI